MDLTLEVRLIRLNIALIELRNMANTDDILINRGICGNLCRTNSLKGMDWKIALFTDLVNRYSEHWSKHSGDFYYPVPYPIKQLDRTPVNTAKHAYDMLPKWSGEYGDLRLELLDYLISATHEFSDKLRKIENAESKIRLIKNTAAYLAR